MVSVGGGRGEIRAGGLAQEKYSLQHHSQSLVDQLLFSYLL